MQGYRKLFLQNWIQHPLYGGGADHTLALTDIDGFARPQGVGVGFRRDKCDGAPGFSVWRDHFRIKIVVNAGGQIVLPDNVDMRQAYLHF